MFTLGKTLHSQTTAGIEHSSTNGQFLATKHAIHRNSGNTMKALGSYMYRFKKKRANTFLYTWQPS